MTGPEPIALGSLAVAASLILINALISVLMSLGLGRRLLVASLRTLVQLSLLGYLLVPIFAANHPGLSLGLAFLMVVVASWEGLRRVSLRYRGIQTDSFLALLIAASVSTFVGTRLVIQLDPFWQPRYLIPLTGMILGNALTGISLGLDRCLTQMRQRAALIEALLALGASPREASLDTVRDALRTGLIPITNSMSVVGLVTIPGMMTGQLLGGVSPATAARYQIVIMFLIAAATAIGVTIVVLLSVRRLFDDTDRLRLDLLGRNGRA
jgi:putative ABC transport system permease protein